MKSRLDGLTAWSVRHPTATTILALTFAVLGLFDLGRMPVELLPDIHHPRIFIMVSNPGVPVAAMEMQVTRPLEKALAITPGVISIRSTTTEGSSVTRLEYEYDRDINVALKDVNARLERLRRFLPKMADPPIVDIRDPSQSPVMEYVLSSANKSPAALRDWVDHVFVHWFENIPGVAAVEAGGGLEHEVLVLPDQQKLAGMGLTVADIVRALKKNAVKEAAVGARPPALEYENWVESRVTTLAQLATLPIPVGENGTVRLDEVARIKDRSEEALRIRLDDFSGVKVSIQNQPEANTMEVANHVRARLDWIRANQVIDPGVVIAQVNDRSVYTRDSLRSASRALLAESILAMLVVWLFLGNWRYALIFGMSITVSLLISFIILQAAGRSLNVMTLGGLTLGIGMLVNSTLIALKKIVRQRSLDDSSPERAGEMAGSGIRSQVFTATAINLVAVLPFLLVGGMPGVLFRDLILAIAAVIATSMIITLTLAPGLAARARLSDGGGLAERAMFSLSGCYESFLSKLLVWRWLVILLAIAASLYAGWFLASEKSGFLPELDNGQINIHLKADTAISLSGMDRKVKLVERLIHQQPHVEHVETVSRSGLSGRSQSQIGNTSIRVQLTSRNQRPITSSQWVRQFKMAMARTDIPGLKVLAATSHIGGFSAGGSNEGISLKLQGPDLNQLKRLADAIVGRLKDQPVLSNPRHTMEDVREEYVIDINHARSAELGLDQEAISGQIRTILSGVEIGNLSIGDRNWPIRIKLSQAELDSPQALQSLLILGEARNRPALRLGDVATVRLEPAPVEVMSDNQRRTIEITATISPGFTLGEATTEIKAQMAHVSMPTGYHYIHGDAVTALETGLNNSLILLGFALFLVFVVMVVRYESLLFPLVILLSATMSLVGVEIGLKITGTPVTMPVWLGMIILAGIVVNNVIVLVDSIQQMYETEGNLMAAVVKGARIRLSLVSMMTLTAVAAISPLAAGFGQGVEIIQPFAITIVSGLTFALLISTILAPVLYYQFHLMQGEEFG